MFRATAALVCAFTLSISRAQSAPAPTIRDAPATAMLALELVGAGGGRAISARDAAWLGSLIDAVGLNAALAVPLRVALDSSTAEGVAAVAMEVMREPDTGALHASVEVESDGIEAALDAIRASLRDKGGAKSAGDEHSELWRVGGPMGAVRMDWADGDIRLVFGSPDPEAVGDGGENSRLTAHYDAPGTRAPTEAAAFALWLDLDALRLAYPDSFSDGRARVLLDLWRLSNARAAMVRARRGASGIELSIAYSARSRPADDVRVRRFSMSAQPGAGGENALCELPIGLTTLADFGLHNVRSIAGGSRDAETTRVERRFLAAYQSTWSRVTRAFAGSARVVAGDAGIAFEWEAVSGTDARVLARDLDTVLRAIGATRLGEPAAQGAAKPTAWLVPIPVGPDGDFARMRAEFQPSQPPRLILSPHTPEPGP